MDLLLCRREAGGVKIVTTNPTGTIGAPGCSFVNARWEPKGDDAALRMMPVAMPNGRPQNRLDVREIETRKESRVPFQPGAHGNQKQELGMVEDIGG